MSHSKSHQAEIIYVLERFPGDTLNFVYNEIRGLEAEGFRVKVYSLLPAIVCPDEAREFLARTTSVRPVSLLGMLVAWLYFLLHSPLELMRLCIKLPLDNTNQRGRKWIKTLGHLSVGVYFAWLLRHKHCHIHAHFAFKAATAALVASRLNGVTFSFTAHGSATVYPQNQFSLRSKIREAEFAVAVSEFNKRTMLELCPEVGAGKIEVNRTGVLLEQFPVLHTRDSSDDQLVIICVASLYAIKNHKGLIRACGLLAERSVPFVLHVVGKDDIGLGRGLKDLAKELKIENQVVFHGGVDHGQIASLLSLADVGILTSFSEGIPVSLMEAMANGLPVVGPRVTGVPELIDEGESGFMADPGDPRTFADALEFLYQNPTRRLEMGQVGRIKIETEYDMFCNAKRLAKIFRSRLGE